MNVKTRLRVLAVVAGLVAVGGTGVAGAAPAPDRAARQDRAAQLKSKPAFRSLAAAPFGNGVFQVHQTDESGVGAGQFTVTTGPANPAGAGRDVLFGQGSPGTSYMIVRDVTDKIDYVQGQQITHADEVSLDDLIWSQTYDEATATTTTTWRLSFFVDITQTVTVTGDSPANARVVVTTSISDTQASPHKYQIQYLWDTAVDADDGPVLQPRTPGQPYLPSAATVGTEQTVTSTQDLVMVDNDRTATAPTLAVALSASGTASATLDSAKYVCWPDAIFAPLGGYQTDSKRNVSGPGSNCLNPQGSADSAVQYLWSGNAATATNGRIEVTASLRMSPPTPYPTTLKAGGLSLGSATATLTDTATGAPLPGRALTFSAGGQDRCTIVTDSAGKATCTNMPLVVLGYDVRYPGGAIWGPSTAHGGL